MTDIGAFPKIFTIGDKYILDIFKEEVEITEKVDGSQFVFGRVGGVLQMRSKGCTQYKEKHDKMFATAVNYVLSIENKLPDNTIFYCEYLKTPKHNILEYGRVPKNNLILFGVSLLDKNFDWDLSYYSGLLDIERIPQIFYGKIEKIEDLIKLLDQESILGKAKVEGIVIKNYQRPFLLGGQAIPLMSGKFVSESFKEVHKRDWVSSKDRYGAFVDSFKTEARWNKAVQHLKEKGAIEGSVRDIGSILKEIQEDITNEEKESIKEYLWNEHKREILGAAIKGFPEWYKEKLLKENFVETTQ